MDKSFFSIIGFVKGKHLGERFLLKRELFIQIVSEDSRHVRPAGQISSGLCQLQLLAKKQEAFIHPGVFAVLCTTNFKVFFLPLLLPSLFISPRLENDDYGGRCARCPYSQAE